MNERLSDFSPITPEAASEALRSSGYSASFDRLQLVSLERKHPARVHGYPAVFLIRETGKPVAHLSIGPNLTGLWQRLDSFAQELPSLVARPIFFHAAGPLDLLVREFPEGKTLAELAVSPPQLADDLRQHAVAALRQLQATARPSTIENAQAEVSEVFNRLSASSILGDFDRAFLGEVVLPLIRHHVADTSPATRWTNGDFLPRNLILQPDGHIRLIDYEFAGRTHFPDDEWRWDTLVSPRRLPALSQPGQFPDWLQMLFWCRQLALSHETTSPGIAAADTDTAIRHLIALLHSQTGAWNRHFFLRHLEPGQPLHGKLGELSAEVSQLRDKLGRMHASRSWRLTAGFRALRRWWR